MWTPPEDCVLTSISYFCTGILSDDPDLTLASWGSSLVGGARRENVLVFNRQSGVTAGFQLVDLSWRLLKNQPIFASLSGAGDLIQLFLF